MPAATGHTGVQAAARWLFVAAVALWFGAVVFMSAVVAPAVFRTLPRPEAGEVVGAIFPAYYLLGSGCGVIVLGAAALLRRAAGATAPWSLAMATAGAALAATLYAATIVQPRATALRGALHAADAPPAVAEEFRRLHTQAVLLNLVSLAALVGLTVVVANRVRP